MAATDVTDAELAVRSDVSRQTIYNRRTGRRSMAIEEVQVMADVLGVPAHLFFQGPVEAIAWIVNNRPELLELSEVTGAYQEALNIAA